MKNKKNIIIGIITLIIICIGAFFYPQKTQSGKKLDFITEKKCGEYTQRAIMIDNSQIDVLIADNDCKRELGLSGTSELKDGEGLFFVFENIGFYKFWMKEMLFPIDMIWISDNLSIVGIEKDIAPNTYPKTFGENYLAKYVLEVPANYSENNNFNIGDKIIFK